MAFIVETILGDKRIQIGSDNLVRQLSFGTGWQKIRIAVRLTLTDIGTSYSSGTGLVMGVCQGTQFPFNHPSCIDFIGMAEPSMFVSLGSWPRSAGSPPYVANPAHQAVKRNNGSITQTTTGASGKSYGLGIRLPMMVDIQKGNPNYTVTLWSTTAYTVEMSRINYLYALEAEGGMANMNGVSVATPYTGAGLLDTLCIHWPKSVPTIEFSDINVVRFY